MKNRFYTVTLVFSIKNRFLLNPLDIEKAREAIVEPAVMNGSQFQTQPFQFTEGTIRTVLDNLKNEVNEIEPFQLQILCQHIEKQILAEQEAGNIGAQASEDYLGGPDGIERILTGFYNDSINGLREKGQITEEQVNIAHARLLLGRDHTQEALSILSPLYINAEVNQLKEEMQRIAETTKWGETRLLDGSTPQFDFQVGIFNNDFTDRISWDGSTNVATLDALGLTAVDFSDKVGAQTGLEDLDAAQTEVNRVRANIGAVQNRLTSTVTNLASAEENLSAANSRVRDADIAAASAELTKNQILMQANTATLAQANQKNTLALQLLG